MVKIDLLFALKGLICMTKTIYEEYLASATVRFLSCTLVPNVRASISSVPVAYTLPALTNTAHWASASPGAYNTIIILDNTS